MPNPITPSISAMKLSFSVKSSSSSRPKPPNSSHPSTSTNTNNSTGDAAEDKHRFVTVFDPSETLDASSDSKPVIVPLENTNQWRATKRMKNLVPASDPSDPSSETARFVLDQLRTDVAGAGTTSFGLNLRRPSKAGDDDADRDQDQGARSPARAEPQLMSDEQRFRMEIQNLPDDRGIDEFNDVSVEDFSRAVLQGYGWKEGKGIGRNSKKDIAVIEKKRWVGTSGLGFNPDAPGSGKKERGKAGPEDKPPLPPARSSNGVDKKKIVRIISGKYAGLKGEILKTAGRSDSESVVLSLLRSGETVTVGVDMITKLGSAVEEKCLRKLKELDVRDGDGRSEDRRGEKRSRDYEQRRSGRDSKIENTAYCASSDSSERDPVYWLRSQIKVRVISKNFKGGRLYLKKGVITDVVGPMTCDLSMEASRELLQGVDQENLETVLPQRGGPVLVLYGRHKGVFGKLVEKNKEKETSMVRDADSHELIKVRMEQIAEYVGDPGDIGY